MYHIAICDDEPYMLEQLSGMVSGILNDIGVPFVLSRCDSLEQLEMRLAIKEEPVHLLLLDILMGGGEDGMDFALRLRRQGLGAGIIFITSSVDYVLRGYDVQAIKYLVKPVVRDELRAAVRYHYQHNYKQEYLAIHPERHVMNILIRDILYIEIEGKRTAIHLNDGGRIVCRDRLGELAAELPADSFCRCHQSFLINLEHVREIVRYQAVMSGRSAVPVSKKYYNDTRESFLGFLSQRLGR